MPETLPRTIALIAHDGKKADMLAFAIQNKDQLRRFQLVATGTTGKLLEDKVGLLLDYLRDTGWSRENSAVLTCPAWPSRTCQPRSTCVAVSKWRKRWSHRRPPSSPPSRSGSSVTTVVAGWSARSSGGCETRSCCMQL